MQLARNNWDMTDSHCRVSKIQHAAAVNPCLHGGWVLSHTRLHQIFPYSASRSECEVWTPFYA